MMLWILKQTLTDKKEQNHMKHAFKTDVSWWEQS